MGKLSTPRTQHKPTRDERKSQELDELKAQNRKLQKQVKRLRKQISKLDIDPCVEEPLEEIVVEQAPAHPSMPKACPTCQSRNLGMTETFSGKKIVGCKDCKKWSDVLP